MGQDETRALRDAGRAAVLARYAILDTPPEPEFDDVVQAAAEACGTPVSLINLLDVDRQWSKAGIGDSPRELPLAHSICALAIQQDGLFEIADAAADPRLADNPLVTGEPPLRFYAGVPLRSPEGVAIGSLCVIDSRPNRLSDGQKFILRTLANQVITTLELRRALRHHRTSDHRSKAIIESAIDYAIVSMDLTGRVTSWNRGAEAILGWSAEEMCGKPAHAFFTEEDAQAGIPEREMGQALLHGRGSDERWHRRKDGSRFYALGEMMPLLDEAGTPEGFIKFLRDRTEQRQAAEKQRADAEFMRSVLAASADCIKVLDLDANLTFMSEGGTRVMEVSDFNLIRGCSWPSFWRGQGNADAIAAVEAARAGGIGHFQGPAETMKGNPRHWDVQVTPILDADGRPERLLSVSRDITVQKSAERDIAASEERYRGLFESLHEGFFTGEILREADGTAADVRILALNPAFAAQSGLPADAAGRTLRALVPDIARSLIDTYARVVETGAPEVFEIVGPEAGRAFEVRAYREDGQRFAALFLDISERKRSERRRAALIELGDRLRDTTDTDAIAGIAAGIMGRTLDLSHAGYGTIDPARETIRIARGWSAASLESLAGLHRFRDYGSYIDDLAAGETVLIADTARDPRTVADAAALAAIDARALANLPVLEHGRFVAMFYLLKASPHAWAPEEVAFLRNVADRTRAAIARVEAEERQRTLNLELSHRMKNMLAMVQSIATQTMRNAGDLATASTVLADRLIALGNSHDLLLGGSLGRTALSALIEGALAPHRDTPERFEIAGPDVQIAAKAATSLALILHELATNAVKYGALSTAEGRVEIGWSLHGEGDETGIRLLWSERGGPPVVPPTRTGFGTRLIGRGLAGNFGGEAHLAYPPTGVTCTIAAALAGLQADDAPRGAG